MTVLAGCEPKWYHTCGLDLYRGDLQHKDWEVNFGGTMVLTERGIVGQFCPDLMARFEAADRGAY